MTDILIRIEKLGEAGAGVDAEVLVALGADVEILFEVLFPSHFTHRPSVRTFFSPEVSSSPDCRLNQVIENL